MMEYLIFNQRCFLEDEIRSLEKSHYKAVLDGRPISIIVGDDLVPADISQIEARIARLRQELERVVEAK